MTFQQAYAKYKAHMVDNGITGDYTYISEDTSKTDGQGAWLLIDTDKDNIAYVDKHGVTRL